MNNFAKFLFGYHRRLGSIIRFNTRIKFFDENVAAHSYYVTLYTMIICKYLNSIDVNKVNAEKAITIALVHDIEECISGDIMKHVKLKMKNAYEEMSKFTADRVFKNVPDAIKKSLIEEAYEFEHGTNDSIIEKKIVKIADDICGIIYCKEEVDLGNKYFVKILDDYMKRLKIRCSEFAPFKEMYDSIEMYVLNSMKGEDVDEY
jgi:5'-deoxynucleotidase